MTEPFERGQIDLDQERKEAFTAVKKYGLCTPCKDRINCVKICESKILEVREKFFKCTDEFGNTEMDKLTFTQAEKIELDETLDYEEMEFQYPAWEYYYQNRSHSRYRHNKSEDIFKETGVRAPTPGVFFIDEVEDYYEIRSKQKGACIGCIVRPTCSKICDAKIEEISAEQEAFRLRTNRESGICKKCKIKDCCLYDNCIDREEEINKMEGKSSG